METNMVSNAPCYPYPWFLSQQSYTQRLVEGFNFCLSPQQLPQNMTARQYMDEELWMPVRILSKLPMFDSLFISDIMFPHVIGTLYQYARNTLEVDVARELVRPKWALRSSVFISSVDTNATTEQIFALLDDIRQTVTHHKNPFEYGKITITRQSDSAWTIGFKSPCAGPYAAMALKTKCINGRMILPMACVHINPPKASYSSAGIAVMEVDALAYGDPIIPPHLVPFYSESPEHLNMLYHTSMVQSAVPVYDAYFHEAGTVADVPIESAETTSSNHSVHKQSRQGREHVNYPGSEAPTPETSEPSEGEASTVDVKQPQLSHPFGNPVSSTRSEIDVSSREDVMRKSFSQPFKKPDYPPQAQHKIAEKPHNQKLREVRNNQDEVANEKSAIIEAKMDAIVSMARRAPLRKDQVEPATPYQTASEKYRKCSEELPPPRLNNFRLPSFLHPIDAVKPITELQSDGRKSYTTRAIHDSWVGQIKDESLATHADISTPAEEPVEIQVTQQRRVQQETSKTDNQRSRTRQRGPQQNGTQPHRKGPRSIPVEHNNRDDMSTAFNLQWKRNHHRRNRSKDSRNGHLQNAHPWPRTPASEHNGDRRAHSQGHSTSEDREWRVICHRRPLQRSCSSRSRAGNSVTTDNGERSDDQDKGSQSPTP